MKRFLSSKENGQGLIEYALILLLVAIVVICILVIGNAVIKQFTSNPIDIYEQAYSACMARETIGHEECHDLAVRTAYPNGRGN